MARPKRIFTEEEIAKIDELALLNCKDYTIANIIGCDVATLTTRFSKRMIQKRAIFKSDLRRGQHAKAVIDKDTGMLCFLGKNELDQEDKRTYKQEGTLTLGASPELIALGKQMAKKYAQEAK